MFAVVVVTHLVNVGSGDAGASRTTRARYGGGSYCTDDVMVGGVRGAWRQPI